MLNINRPTLAPGAEESMPQENTTSGASKSVSVLTEHQHEDDEVGSESSTDGDLFDLTEIVNSTSCRFPLKFGLIVTGLIWFLSGAQITLTLFVTMEPPKFPICSSGLVDESVPLQPALLPLAKQQLPNIPLKVIGNNSALEQPILRGLQNQPQPTQSPGFVLNPEFAACNPDVPLPPLDCTSRYTYKHPSVSIVSDFDIQTTSCNNKPWQNVTWIHSALFAGILFGALFVAPMCDKIGRRPVLTIGTLILTASALCSALSFNVYMYGASRFAVGLGSASSTIPSVVLLSELVPTSKRQWIVGIQACAFAIAAAYTSILSCLIPSWRLVTLFGIFPAFYFLCGCVCCAGVYVESPKWLSARGRMEESFHTWLHIAAVNKTELAESLDLDKFTRLELESLHKIRLKNKADIDEELSLMSIQQLAAPDKLSKALTTFPLSIWLCVSVWIWIVAAMVYYGVLLDFSNVLQALNISEASDGRALAAVPPAGFVNGTFFGNASAGPQNFMFNNSMNPNEAHMYALYANGTQASLVVAPGIRSAEREEHIPSMAAEIADLYKSLAVPSQDKHYAKDPVEQGHSFPPSNLSDVNVAARDGPLLNISAFPDLNAKEKDERSILNPAAEYFKMVGGIVGNESKLLLERARHLPDTANRFYNDYKVNQKWKTLVSDMSAQFQSSDPMAGYWRHLRIQSVVILGSFLAEIPAYMIAMNIASRSWGGRKRTTMFLYAFGGISLLLTAPVKYLNIGSSQDQARIILLLALIGRSFIAAVFVLIYLYSAELVPTSIRASSIGLCSALARIGCVFAAPMANYLDHFKEGSALIVFGILCISATFVTFTALPETLDKPLYDTVESLELAYEKEGFREQYYSHPINRLFTCLGRNLCCFGKKFRRCLGDIHTDDEPDSFEDRGRVWIKKRWSQPHRQSKSKASRNIKYQGLFSTRGASHTHRTSETSKFVPLSDMNDENETQFTSMSNSRSMAKGAFSAY